MIPAHPFGHGLGYTSWELVDLTVAEAASDGSTEATVTVRNTGNREGKCVVQLYLERPVSAVERPARWLAGFEVLRLRAGDSCPVTVRLPWRRFAHWTDRGWRVEPGDFRLVAGLSSADDRLAAAVTIRAPERPGAHQFLASAEGAAPCRD